MEERSNSVFKGFGAKIKEKRLSLGLTQEKAAERLNINESYYSRIERGDRSFSVGLLLSIANFYNLSLDYLLGFTQGAENDKLLSELESIFKDKNPSESAFLLNLLKVQAENVKRLLP